MKIIKTLLKAVGKYPCFVWPVFTEDGEYFLPSYNADGKNRTVIEFRQLASFDAQNGFNVLIELSESEWIAVDIGHPALFAYAISETDYKVGNYELIREYLSHFITVHKDVFDKLDYAKQIEILKFINDVDLLNRFLVDTLENTNSPQVKYNATAELRRLESSICKADKADKIILHDIAHATQHSDEIINVLNNLNVNSKDYIRRLINNAVGKNYFNRKDKQNIIQFIVERNKCEIMRDLMKFDNFAIGSTGTEYEPQTGRGALVLDGKDYVDNEVPSDMLDIITNNISTGMSYDYYFSSSVDEACIKLIYRIKAGILARNPEIDTKKSMCFWDVSDWDKANTYEKCLQNIIIWEEQSEEVSKDTTAFVMLCGTSASSAAYARIADDCIDKLLMLTSEMIEVRIAIPVSIAA